jgi:hypothetical protein
MVAEAVQGWPSQVSADVGAEIIGLDAPRGRPSEPEPELAPTHR